MRRARASNSGTAAARSAIRTASFGLWATPMSPGPHYHTRCDRLQDGGVGAEGHGRSRLAADQRRRPVRRGDRREVRVGRPSSASVTMMPWRAAASWTAVRTGRGVDFRGIAVFQSGGGDGHGHVDGGAVVVDDDVEVAERRVVAVILERAIGQDPVEQGFHFRQEGDQGPVGVAAGALGAVGLDAVGRRR